MRSSLTTARARSRVVTVSWPGIRSAKQGILARLAHYKMTVDRIRNVYDALVIKTLSNDVKSESPPTKMNERKLSGISRIFIPRTMFKIPDFGRNSVVIIHISIIHSININSHVTGHKISYSIMFLFSLFLILIWRHSIISSIVQKLISLPSINRQSYFDRERCSRPHPLSFGLSRSVPSHN